MKPTITVTEGGDLAAVRKALANLSKARVYVGIPETKTSRKGEVVTNAGLMFIHTHGAHLPNGAVIPPRPVIEPAIEAEDNRAMITDEMGLAANAELEGKPDETLLHLKLAGTLGANAAKRWFTDPRNGWPQNAPSTIRRKLRKLEGKKYTDAIEVLDSVTKHMPQTGTTDLDKINTPLIDLGELRRAITHVEEVGE